MASLVVPVSRYWIGSRPRRGRASTTPAAVRCCNVCDTEGCWMRQSCANSAWVCRAAGSVAVAQHKTRSQYVAPSRSSSSNWFRRLSTGSRSSGRTGLAPSANGVSPSRACMPSSRLFNMPRRSPRKRLQLLHHQVRNGRLPWPVGVQSERLMAPIQELMHFRQRQRFQDNRVAKH